MTVNKKRMFGYGILIVLAAGLGLLVRHFWHPQISEQLAMLTPMFFVGKNFFKSSKSSPEVSVVADPYKKVRESLVDWLGGQVGKPGKTYPGELVAPMSEPEQKSQAYLEQYASGTPSTTRQLGKQEIESTLSGEYDPSKSPYYQAVKAEMARNLEDTQKSIADMAAGGGRYWTGARLGEQREAQTDYLSSLNTFLGQLAESERDKKLQVLPQALQYATEEEQEPLRKTAALQEFGALPRTIQQAIDQALYNEYLRTEQDYPLAIAQLAAGVQQAPLYGQVGYSPSMFSQLASPLLSSFGSQAGTTLASKLFGSK